MGQDHKAIESKLLDTASELQVEKTRSAKVSEDLTEIEETLQSERQRVLLLENNMGEANGMQQALVDALKLRI